MKAKKRNTNRTSKTQQLTIEDMQQVNGGFFRFELGGFGFRRPKSIRPKYRVPLGTSVMSPNH